ncbi:MAG: cyclic pyranopterin monophosphate synthase MoaC [Candidatus Anammoxibacter sp.]
MEKSLTHFDDDGASRMVDVGSKDITERVAIAHAKVVMKPETLKAITDEKLAKGNALEVARVAGILGAKQTSTLIPMCHPLNLTSIKIDFSNNGIDSIGIYAEVKTQGKTGVEMEALAASTICALTIYDMCKSMDKEIVIEDVHLMSKSGGKSGDFTFNNKRLNGKC